MVQLTYPCKQSEAYKLDIFALAGNWRFQQLQQVIPESRPETHVKGRRRRQVASDLGKRRKQLCDVLDQELHRARYANLGKATKQKSQADVVTLGTGEVGSKNVFEGCLREFG